MVLNIFGSGLWSPQPIKRKVFVSYHHGGDQAYYDAFLLAFCDLYDVIADNSLERQIDSDNVEYVMRRIREDYIQGSSCTIVLVGRDTWSRKYVDWEIKATLDKSHGLIGIQLPSLPINSDGRVAVPGRLSDNIDSGYALWLSWQQITRSAAACTRFIEQANSRDKRRIINTRERRLRNG
jgi:hypothetical protein